MAWNKWFNSWVGAALAGTIRVPAWVLDAGERSGGGRSWEKRMKRSF